MHQSHLYMLSGFILLGLGIASGRTLDAQTPRVFRAGAAAVDVTPREFPVKIAGGFLEGTATSAHDHLFARCLVLEDGESRVAITVVDNCLIPRDLFDEAKLLALIATELPSDCMLMSATHTHSAPAVVSVLGTDVDESYRKLLPGQIAQAVETAAKNLAPARIGWAVVDDPEHTHCRQWIRRPDRVSLDPFGHRTVRSMMHPGYQNPDYLGPAGPADTGISIVSVQSPNGRPIALLANYSMHYVGSPPLSADYFGAFAARIAELLGAGNATPPFVGILSNGTAGDQHYMDYGEPEKKQDMYSVADAVARKVVAAAAKIEYRDWVPLVMRERTIQLGIRPISEEDLSRAKEAFAKMGERKPQTFAEVYPREQVLLGRAPATHDLKLQALRIGDLGIVAVPCEVFGITGLKIKALSPLTPTFTIELANGYDGYIPPPEQHRLGGYTTWRARSACLEVLAEPKIVSAVLGLLEEVAGKSRRSPADSDYPMGGYPDAVLASKPVAYWRLNEFGGSLAADATGHGHDATYEGPIAFYLEGPGEAEQPQSGRGNRAPQIAGGHIRAILPGLGAKYTAEMWFYNCLPTDARAITGYLFARESVGLASATGDRLAIGGTLAGTGRLLLDGGGSARTPLAGKTPIPLKQWNHVAMVRDGAKVVIYLNGETVPDASADDMPSSITGADQVFIGGCATDTSGLEGRIDEVAVYDRALSANEVSGHFRATAGPSGRVQ